MMRNLISAVLLTACLLVAQGIGPVFADDAKPPPPPPASGHEISHADRQAAEMMEMLKLMDMLEQMDMMEDYDVIRGGAKNDKSG